MPDTDFEFTFEDSPLPEPKRAPSKPKPPQGAPAEQAKLPANFKLETGEFPVHDSEGNEIGVLHYPLSFCECPCELAKQAPKNPYSYHQLPQLGWWVCMYCHRPTKKWWAATFTDRVMVNNGVTLPWA